MNVEAIIQALEDSGLGQYKEAISSWIYPTAELLLEPVPDTSIPIAGSKIGGCPDLAEDTTWPTWKDYHMTFIAQINLAECPSQLSLPSSGLLSFFYTAEAMYEGDFDFYKDPGTCRVIYIRADQFHLLSRQTIPECLHVDARMRPNRISFKTNLSVPPSESAYLESLGLGWNGNMEDFKKYWGTFLPQWRKDGCLHRLMGHPDQIQGDMQLHCQTLYEQHGWSGRDTPGMPEQKAQAALKWRLLLQIDSEEDKTGISWGDAGRIYFWIHEDDLASLCFDRVVCEMQCT
ncbi:DUF1963 domain-containing protein [Paenibacillus campinasensis]|uniref:DUF1963 domain-containing protein n=1 Tax=Paenibacillus campinasensis TaxID=66347 RepID=A0ABW9T2C3_9BACL|nr:DUF1963 domain-containing protein [Paenibacillus campinasensis]